SLRWQLLAKPFGFQQPARQFVAFYFIGMFFNLVLPTSVGGDVVRAWYLDGGQGRRMVAFFSVLLDRCSGLMVLLVLGCIALYFCPLALPGWIGWSVWGTTIGIALAAPVMLLARSRLSKTRSKAETAGLATLLKQPGVILSTTALSVIVQAGNVVMVWLV